MYELVDDCDGLSPRRAMIPWDFGIRGGATVTLKLKKVSCDLLHTCQKGCNDFHPHCERLYKFQEATSINQSYLAYLNESMLLISYLQYRYILLNQREGCFLRPSVLLLHLQSTLARPAWRDDIMKMKWLSLQAYWSSPGQMSLFLCALIMLHHFSRWCLAPRRSWRRPQLHSTSPLAPFHQSSPREESRDESTVPLPTSSPYLKPSTTNAVMTIKPHFVSFSIVSNCE